MLPTFFLPNFQKPKCLPNILVSFFMLAQELMFCQLFSNICLYFLCNFDCLLSVLFLFLNTYFCIYELILPYIMICVNTYFYFFEINFTFSEINVIIYYGGENLWVFLTNPYGKC